MRPSRFPPNPSLASATLALAMALAGVSGCTQHPARTDAGNAIPADLSFHRSLKLDEYMRPFSQEELSLPERSEVVLQVT